MPSCAEIKGASGWLALLPIPSCIRPTSHHSCRRCPQCCKQRSRSGRRVCQFLGLPSVHKQNHDRAHVVIILKSDHPLGQYCDERPLKPLVESSCISHGNLRTNSNKPSCRYGTSDIGSILFGDSLRLEPWR